ncbi:MAG: DNA repair protein [Pseudomonadota bacterium]|nr:DNA repair protein [Pseudomonadota bacterium]
MYQRAEHALKLDGLGPARSFFEGCFAGCDPTTESLWVAHVDEETRCLHVSRHDGDEAGTAFPIHAILSDALQHQSAGIVLAHNHPSGNASPSDSDCRATKRLAVAAEALDCTVIDHLVFAGRDCASLRQMGLL